MGAGRGVRGLSSVVVVTLALVASVALSFLALYHSNITTYVAQEMFREEVAEKAMLERLNLVFWSNDGRARISNCGDVPVTIVGVYTDSGEVWRSRGRPPVTIQPKEVVELDIGSGSTLVVETSTGNLIVLRRGTR